MSAALAEKLPIREAMELVAAETGLIFPKGRRSDFERGVRRTMARWKCHDIHDLIARFRSDRRMFADLIGELAVYETYFFRDPEQLNVVRELVLPELAGRIGTERPLQIWSAGCASGEEPYSLAILLEQEALAARARICATDISEPALEAAKKASYGAWSFRSVSEEFATRYFAKRGNKRVLDARLRQAVEFTQMNLVSGETPRCEGGGFDLILCRNVLIYFDARTIALVANRLYAALGEGGWLVTAPSDPPLWSCAPFATETTRAGVIYRKIRAAPKPATAAIAPAFAEPAAIPFKPKEIRRARSPAIAPKRAHTGRKAADILAQAREALANGANGRVLALTEHLPLSHDACVFRLQALVNAGRTRDAEAFAASAVTRNPLSVELRYLRALVLFDLGRMDEAVDSVCAALYLDRALAAGHFLLATILRKLGDRDNALRSYRNTLAACSESAADSIVPLTDNEPAGRLAEAAAAAIASLEPAERNR